MKSTGAVLTFHSKDRISNSPYIFFPHHTIIKLAQINCHWQDQPRIPN